MAVRISTHNVPSVFIITLLVSDEAILCIIALLLNMIRSFRYVYRFVHSLAMFMEKNRRTLGVAIHSFIC